MMLIRLNPTRSISGPPSRLDNGIGRKAKNPASAVLDGLPVVSSTNHGITRRVILFPVSEIAFAVRSVVERGPTRNRHQSSGVPAAGRGAPRGRRLVTTSVASGLGSRQNHR